MGNWVGYLLAAAIVVSILYSFWQWGYERHHHGMDWLRSRQMDAELRDIIDKGVVEMHRQDDGTWDC